VSYPTPERTGAMARAKVTITVSDNGRIAVESESVATNKQNLKLILEAALKLVDQMQA
jgi:hypothetical protein